MIRAMDADLTKDNICASFSKGESHFLSLLQSVSLAFQGAEHCTIPRVPPVTRAVCPSSEKRDCMDVIFAAFSIRTRDIMKCTPVSSQVY